MPYSNPDEQARAQAEWYQRKKRGEVVPRAKQPVHAAIEMPKSLRGAHEEIARIRDAHEREASMLRARGFDEDEPSPVWNVPGDSYLLASYTQTNHKPLPGNVLCISATQVRRALLVLHGITREAKQRGWEVEWFAGRKGRWRPTSPTLALTIEGERVSLAVREQLTKKPSTRKPRRSSYSSDREIHCLRYKRSLEVIVGDGYGSWKLADKVKRKVEDELGRIIAKVADTASEQAASRERFRVAEIQRAQERLRYEQDRHDAELAAQRDHAVIAMASARETRASILDLAAEFEASGRDDAEEWIRWTRDLAERLDPLHPRSNAVIRIATSIAERSSAHRTRVRECRATRLGGGSSGEDVMHVALRDRGIAVLAQS